jgi:hypothetical protein
LDLNPKHNAATKVAAFPLPTNPGYILNFVGLSIALHDHLHDQTSRRELAELVSSPVSIDLRTFSQSTKLTGIQHRLAEETIRCLRIGAFRSAVVMGWNLVYDILRCWIIDDQQRSDTFNRNLQTVNSGRSPIATYADFIEASKPPSEADVIKSCRGANGQNVILQDKIVRHFEQALNFRNDYAHPNFSDASFTWATAYVEGLLKIVCNPPFADPTATQQAASAPTP